MISHDLHGQGERRSKLTIVANDPRPLKSQPMHNWCSALVKKVLDKHSEIRSVANIGARVNVVSAHLAPLYPDVLFTSVDLQEGIVAGMA